jgi:hypothetical protein
MVQLYLQHVLQEEPEDVRADAVRFFGALGLREKVEAALLA